MCDIKVSIVMPVYNAEKYLDFTIKSIINQTYDNWELIAVDDCSNDNSREILINYKNIDSRIQPIFSCKNSGAAISRNIGIRASTGLYLAFIDSDDTWYPDKLQLQLQYMKNNHYAFTFTSYDLISQDGINMYKKVIAPFKITYKEALTKTVIWTSTVMLDINTVGKFEMPNLRAAQDTATWLKLLKVVPAAYGIDQVLASYRQVPGSISNNFRRRVTRMWKVYRMVEKISIAKSFYYYIQYVIYVLKKRKKYYS